MEELWERIRRGRHTAVLGPLSGDPPASLGLRLIRVRCDVPPTVLGPLFEARRKVEQILDNHAPLFEQARERMVAGLRRRLLGDLPMVGAEGEIVETWNRLAQHSDRPSALVFDAVDAADEATLDGLQRILNRPGWLHLPLVLVFRSVEPSGAARALLDTLIAIEGEGALVRVAPAEGDRAALSPVGKQVVDLRSLPIEVLRVLRAGALIGSGFEADLVANLLGESTLSVLDCLQYAADAGVPFEDNGEGRFHMADPLVESLRSSLLPSLAVAWHRRLAALLSYEGEPEAPVPAEEERPSAPSRVESVLPGPSVRAPVVEELSVAERSFEVPPAPATTASPMPARIQGHVLQAEGAPPAAAEAASEERQAIEEPTLREAEESSAPQTAWPYEEIFSSAAPEAALEAAPEAESKPEAAPAPEPAAEVTRAFTAMGAGSRRPESASVWETVPMGPFEGPRTSPMALSMPGPQVDEARAAGHLLAAGEPEAGAERYFAASQQAARMGAYGQAMAYGQKALALLEALPPSPRRRRIRAQMLLELGRLQWQVAGPEPAFTLQGALEVLDKARAELSEDDPPELKAEVSAVIASVCYDLGDIRSLERAIAELTQASRLLLAAGRATSAARLLNDQAAVYVRAGDPVQATHLLAESRRIFEERASRDPIALIEMAETDHLFARIPLHVPARPGRESDALSMGLDHAIAAERTYRKLGAMRELSRVWETMGRLELRKGRLERASARLTEAIRVQGSIGDVLGLARSTAAMAEVLSASGRHVDAFGLLGDSIVLNLEKGSPIGLAFNRRAFESLRGSAPADPEAQAALEAVAERLSAAESVLGRVGLPGEVGEER